VKIATISQTKNQLSALLDQVRHGETILVVDRNRPVARIEPVGAGPQQDVDGRLVRLERAGLLKRGNADAGRRALARPAPKPRRGGDILQALLDERGEGR
jgi:prevent-host-death family protein